MEVKDSKLVRSKLDGELCKMIRVSGEEWILKSVVWKRNFRKSRLQAEVIDQGTPLTE